jgi:hypothetical protein
MIAFVTAQTLDNPGTPEERAEKMTARMQQELSLTEAQLPDIQVLNLKYAKIMQAEVIDPDLNVWTMYSRGNKINKRKEEELKPLLTDVQWKKYEQMRAAVTSKIWKKIF